MTVFDAHGNLAVSAVATAPSPASSGTSLIVTAGQGVRFPTPPFNATICPAATQPDPSNAEIVRVTGISTDTLTITRAQEGTSARTVLVTDQIFASISAKVLTDIETWANAQQKTMVNPAAKSMVVVPGVCPGGVGSMTIGLVNEDFYFPFACEDNVTFDRVQTEIVTANSTGGSLGRIALYNATASWQPTGTLIEDFGTFATDSTGVKALTPGAGTRTLPPGRYVLAYNSNGATNVLLRAMLGSPPGGLWVAAGGGFQTSINVARTFAAFPSTGSTWTAGGSSSSALFTYPIFLRVTAVG